ncbi:MAG: hypothetical protein Q9227_008620 [Pyrenula ochraceoflavens]
MASRLSQRFYALAGDSEIWKEKYYARWVRPRARRIPNIRRSDNSTSVARLRHSMKLAKWLEHGHLTQNLNTDWKRQYKLKLNWSQGTAKVKEFAVKQAPLRPISVKLCNGTIVVVDREHGLRAWDIRTHKLLVSEKLDLPSTSWSNPTALSVSSFGDTRGIDMAVGFENGAFRVYTLHPGSGALNVRYTRPPSTLGAITAISLALPYLSILCHNRSMSVYQFTSVDIDTDTSRRLEHPHLLTSLTAPRLDGPLALTIRISPANVVASIAFLTSRFHNTWCVGLQEVYLKNLASKAGSISPHLEVLDDNLHAREETQHDGISEDDISRLSYSDPLDFSSLRGLTPTSINYSHPYLLISYPDNTMEICLVKSNTTSLSIGSGRRLWGHTSAISGAEVNDRGRAVSVSQRGNEVRIWDLEEIATSASESKPRKTSVPITDSHNEVSIAKGWVGFDEEQVLVLREWQHGMQALRCYDFS